MSVAAMAWAFRQKVPPGPKVVLLALADQADERTGRVCYGKTDMPHLADKCAIPLRTLARAIDALVRNQYVLRESGQRKRVSNKYWLCLARDPAESIKDWRWRRPGQSTSPDQEDTDDTDDTDGVADDSDHATVALSNRATVACLNGSDRDTGGMRNSANGGTEKESIEVPKNIYARARSATGFDPKAQAADIEQVALQRFAEKAAARYFVIEGSRAWEAWCRYRKAKIGIGSMPSTAGTGEHVGKRGWFLPSLFPPPEQDSRPRTPDEEFIAQKGLG